MKLKQLIVASLCGLTAFGCNTESDSGKGSGSGNTPGEPTEISVGIRRNGTTRASSTIPGTDKENAIYVLEFYVFDKDGNPDSEVGKETKTPGYVRFETSESKRRIVVSSGEDKKFVAVVNMDLGSLKANEDYTALKKRLAISEFKATFGGNDHNSRDEDREGGFEMSGESIATAVAGKLDNQVEILAKRLVSRINAPIYKNGSNPTGVDLTTKQIADLWGEDSGITTDKLSFNPLGYAVINGITRSDVFFTGNDSGDPEKLDGSNLPDWSDWSWISKDGNNIAKSYLNSSFNTDGFYTNNYSGQGSIDWFLDGTQGTNGHRVYVFENKPKTITVEEGTGYDALNVYAFMLKGDLIVDGDLNNINQLNKTRYWRVDLTRDDDYHIMRNSVYDVYILKITSIGHENPEGAEKENPIVPGKNQTSADIYVDISEWVHKVYGTEV